MRRPIPLVIAMLAMSPVAAAEQQITDGTAFTLAPGEVRIDALRSSVGLPAPRALSGLELSTYSLPWAAYLASSDSLDVSMVNAQLKASRTLAPRWTGALTAAALYGRISADDAGGGLLVLPFEAHVNYRLHRRIELGATLQHTYISIDAGARSMDDPDRYSFDAAARTDNTHAGVSAQLRIASWLSLIGEGHVTYFHRISAGGEGTFQVDPDTTVEVMAEASGAPPAWGASVRGILHWTLGPVNLRTGLTYGNYVMPMLNLAVPVKYPMPTFNLYLRF